MHAVTGEGPDPSGLVRSWQLAIGMAALASVREAFITKSRGGTDEMGITWPPLKPETIARRRIGKEDLKNPEIRRWNELRKSEEERMYNRYLLSLSEYEARQRARQVAPALASKKMGKTRVELLGNRTVDILRDTGRLFNSLMPAEQGYAGADGQAENVFEASDGIIRVGTNVKYAGTHQYGNPARNVPARPFFPPEAEMIPDLWWQDWLDASERAFLLVVLYYLGQPQFVAAVYED